MYFCLCLFMLLTKGHIWIDAKAIVPSFIIMECTFLMRHVCRKWHYWRQISNLVELVKNDLIEWDSNLKPWLKKINFKIWSLPKIDRPARDPPPPLLMQQSQQTLQFAFKLIKFWNPGPQECHKLKNNLVFFSTQWYSVCLLYKPTGDSAVTHIHPAITHFRVITLPFPTVTSRSCFLVLFLRPPWH